MFQYFLHLVGGLIQTPPAPVAVTTLMRGGVYLSWVFILNVRAIKPSKYCYSGIPSQPWAAGFICNYSLAIKCIKSCYMLGHIKWLPGQESYISSAMLVL